jgi:saccharopine dehydrogenase-like NADP-dependent oxidoreductase
MRRVLVVGAGRIGQTISAFLATAGDYSLTVADIDKEALAGLEGHERLRTAAVDASQTETLLALMQNHEAVISVVNVSRQPGIASAALGSGVSYFDLTEDVQNRKRVTRVADRAVEGQIFMPQCGLAPGFVSVVAASLARPYDTIESVEMRVGALPLHPSNALRYNLTWSPEGLVNEYCQPCEAISDGEQRLVEPLEGLEELVIDGDLYEAFNTSGGLGTLCDSLAGRVRELTYKTIRYPGHRDLMAFLLKDLRLCERQDLVIDILERAIPGTKQDVVVVFCAASGMIDGEYRRTTDVRKLYPADIAGETRAAIQRTTAAGVCAMVDLHFEGKLPSRGLVRQEQVPLDVFLENRFGQHFVPPEIGGHPTVERKPR